MKSQEEEEAKAPDDSKINQQKPRISLTCLYANQSLSNLSMPDQEVLHLS